ncbi:MAG: rRNA pseudouridine synthase [Candidatus Moraniibacteriota bacterium]|nr:MAG: rRNA pseudouridine synthase [Candidatus Moranbacteria bacterium]
MLEEPIPFPLRINRYLALRGIATRKAADALIVSGKVHINGRPAELGAKVAAEDIVEVRHGGRARSYRYFAYYKPRGIISHSPVRGERAITDIFSEKGVFPVGRLDKASEGLIIVTDDGRITERLLHPRFVHEKEYEVRVQEEVPASITDRLIAGVESEGDLLRAKKAKKTGRFELDIILTEGKKHQIRRMLGALHLTVKELRRVRIMNILLNDLGPGEARRIAGSELEVFLKKLGLVSTETLP